MEGGALTLTGSRGKYLLAWEEDDVIEAYWIGEERGFFLFVDDAGKRYAARRDSLSRFEKKEDVEH